MSACKCKILEDPSNVFEGSRTKRVKVILSLSDEIADDSPCFSRFIPRSFARVLVRKADEGAQILTYKELCEWYFSQEEAFVKQKLLTLFSRKDYAPEELRRKFLSDGYTSETIEKLIDTYVRCGLIDETRLAHAFIRSKLNAGWGIRRIQFELHRKGIQVDTSVINTLIEEEHFDSEYDRAFALASRKHIKPPHMRVKLARFLASRGFSSQIAYRVASELVPEERFED